MKDKEPERYQQMQEFLHSFMLPAIQNVVTKKSIYDQYVSDLVTKIDEHIEKKGTTVHVFYALGMGESIELVI